MVFFMLLFGCCVLLGLITLTLELEAYKVKEIELKGAVGAATEHVRRIIVHAYVLHETVCILEFLDGMYLKLLLIYLVDA